MLLHDLNIERISFEDFAYLRLGESFPIADITVYCPLDGYSAHTAAFIGDPSVESSPRHVSASGSVILDTGEVLSAQVDASAKAHRIVNAMRRITLRPPLSPTVYANIDVAWQDGQEPLSSHLEIY